MVLDDRRLHVYDDYVRVLDDSLQVLGDSLRVLNDSRRGNLHKSGKNGNIVFLFV